MARVGVISRSSTTIGAVLLPTTDVTGTIQLPEGTEMVMPGDNVAITVELGKVIAMDEGLRFAIREGGRTVGAGRDQDYEVGKSPMKEPGEIGRNDR